MSAPELDTLRIFIPLTIKRRNGRPRIMPPEDFVEDDRTQDPRLVRAIARAWSWRRKLERGEVGTLNDIAKSEGVTTSFVSRFLRLSYLSPSVLEQLIVHRRRCAISIEQLAAAAIKPWAEQPVRVFEG